MERKLQLNNCIISLRANVKKAKVRTICKLVRKVKSFKRSQEKHPENAKLGKLDVKIKKYMEEIETLKNMDKVTNVKKIFTFSGNTMGVMANQNAAPLDRAVAKLIFNNEFLRESIKKHKERLNLKDDDEEWKNELLAMGKTKQKKLKKLGVKVEGGKKKTQKVKKEPSQEEEGSKPSKNAKKKMKQKKAVKEEKMDTGSAAEESPKKKKKKTADNGDVETPKSPKKLKKEDKSDKLLRMNEKSKKIHPKAKKTPLDFSRSRGKNFQKNKDGSISLQFTGKGFRKPFENGSGNDNASKDHPSWEAKKKQKPAIAKFQGKKTKFSE